MGHIIRDLRRSTQMFVFLLIGVCFAESNGSLLCYPQLVQLARHAVRTERECCLPPSPYPCSLLFLLHVSTFHWFHCIFSSTHKSYFQPIIKDYFPPSFIFSLNTFDLRRNKLFLLLKIFSWIFKDNSIVLVINPSEIEHWFAKCCAILPQHWKRWAVTFHSPGINTIEMLHSGAGGCCDFNTQIHSKQAEGEGGTLCTAISPVMTS